MFSDFLLIEFIDLYNCCKYWVIGLQAYTKSIIIVLMCTVGVNAVRALKKCSPSVAELWFMSC